MRKLLASAFVLVLGFSTAVAGPLNTETVAADANWVAHLDVEAMMNSGLAKFILGEAEKKADFLEGIAKARETLGFDPLKDIRALTLYGPRFGEEAGVVILDATADQSKLLELLKANETHKEIAYGERTLHQWTDPPKPTTNKETGEEVIQPGKTKFGCFYSEKAILIATDLPLLKGAIEVMDGKADSLAKSQSLKMLPKPAEGAFLVVAGDDIRLPAGGAHPPAAMLRTLTDLSLQVGESQGSTFLSITALAEDAEKALKLRQVVQGLVALGQMQMQERQDLPVLGEKIAVTGAENVVQIDAAVPTDSLIKMIQFMGEQARAKAAAAAAQGDAAQKDTAPK